jgi:hypothetical protein
MWMIYLFCVALEQIPAVDKFKLDGQKCDKFTHKITEV